MGSLDLIHPPFQACLHEAVLYGIQEVNQGMIGSDEDTYTVDDVFNSALWALELMINPEAEPDFKLPAAVSIALMEMIRQRVGFAVVKQYP